MNKQEKQEERSDLETLLETDRAFRSDYDRRVGRAIQTARAGWEREQTDALARARAEAVADGRAEGLASLEGQRQALQRQMLQQQHRELELQIGAKLQEYGLSAQFAPWLTAETEEESLRRVEEFRTLFLTALSREVTDRMRGGVPIATQGTAVLDREALRTMAPAEINARWEEIQNTILKGD